MLRLLADENFKGEIVRGLRLRRRELDIVRAQDVGLAGADDPAVLEWAAENDRIVLTYDRATMSDFAYARITAGLEMPGLFILNDRLAVAQAIEEILIVVECSDQIEWSDRAIYLPL